MYAFLPCVYTKTVFSLNKLDAKLYLKISSFFIVDFFFFLKKRDLKKDFLDTVDTH